MRSALVAFMILSGCSLGAGMPVERPHDFRVEVHDGGGMVPFNETYSVRNDSAVYEVWDTGKHRRCAFACKAQQLDSLYDFLRKQQVHRMRHRTEQEVYDRGGTSMHLLAEGNSFQVSNSGLDFIEDKWAQPYNESIYAVKEFVRRGVDSLRRALHVRLSYGDSLGDLRDIHVSLGNNDLLHWRAIEAVPPPENAHALEIPGEHLLVLNATLNGKYLSFAEGIVLPDTGAYIHLKLMPEGFFLQNP